jgi:tryptophan-rich sensory protein
VAESAFCPAEAVQVAEEAARFYSLASVRLHKPWQLFPIITTYALINISLRRLSACCPTLILLTLGDLVLIHICSPVFNTGAVLQVPMKFWLQQLCIINVKEACDTGDLTCKE